VTVRRAITIPFRPHLRFIRPVRLPFSPAVDPFLPSVRPSSPRPPASRRIASAGYLDRLEIQEGLANPDIDWTLLGFDEGVKERHLFQARPISHRSPYDRVGAVNADPQGLSPAHLSAHTSLSLIPALDAFQLRF
jgi:hypothetical protein